MMQISIWGVRLKLGPQNGKGYWGSTTWKISTRRCTAKQCWRVLQNPESLATKILKVKYFLMVIFLEQSWEIDPLMYRGACGLRRIY